MNLVPHEYQLAMMRFLLQNSNAGLFVKMGLGKTAVVLGALSVLKSKKMLRRALIVAPLRVATFVWRQERDKWADFRDLSIVTLHGSKKASILTDIPKTQPDIVTITPEGLTWLCDPAYPARVAALDADVLVVDESSFFRHHTSLRFKNLRSILHLFKRRYILTGTPAPRGYLDLWTQAFIMDMGGALGSYVSHYRSRYFTDVGYQYSDWQIQPGAAEKINEKLKPLVLLEDSIRHLDMPELKENQIKVTLPAAVMVEYGKLEKAFFLALPDGTDVMPPNAAALGTKLRQVANGFVYREDGSAYRIHYEKMRVLKELVESLGSESALIVYEFTEDRHEILQSLAGAEAMVPNMTIVAAEDLTQRFNNGQLQFLVVHPASAGHGLSLQGSASHIIWMGPTWKLEHYLQTVARVWRQGNKHATVVVHTLVAEGTRDARVAAALSSNSATQESLLQALRRDDQPVVS